MQYAAALPQAGANHGFRLRALGNERLAVLAAAGDAGAFGVLYERHHAALYRYCNSILRQHDDAEDAAQSTMTRALAALERRDPDAAWSAWLFRIAHNESIDRLRARRRFDELGEADGAGVVALEPHIEHRERLRQTSGRARGRAARVRAARAGVRARPRRRVLRARTRGHAARPRRGLARPRKVRRLTPGCATVRRATCYDSAQQLNRMPNPRPVRPAGSGGPTRAEELRPTGRMVVQAT